MQKIKSPKNLEKALHFEVVPKIITGINKTQTIKNDKMFNALFSNLEKIIKSSDRIFILIHSLRLIFIDKRINDIIIFMHQNKGVFLEWRKKHFVEITEEEFKEMERIYKEVFSMATKATFIVFDKLWISICSCPATPVSVPCRAMFLRALLNN